MMSRCAMPRVVVHDVPDAEDAGVGLEKPERE
jgi:hypothetical protein